MLNKNKGFTLIEALAVLAIIAIIAVIATPNIIKIMNNDKKNQVQYDASEMISKAKYYYKFEDNKVGGEIEKFITEGACQSITLEKLNISKLSSPYTGEEYDLSNSMVKVCLNVDTYEYSVKLKTSGTNGHCLGTCDTYILEDNIKETEVIEY